MPDASKQALKGLEDPELRLDGEAQELLTRYRREWARLGEGDWENRGALGLRVSKISQRPRSRDRLLRHLSTPRLMAAGMAFGCFCVGVPPGNSADLSALVGAALMFGLCWLLPAMARPLRRPSLHGLEFAYWWVLAPMMAQVVMSLARSRTLLSDMPLSLGWLAQVSGETLRACFHAKIWFAAVAGGLLGSWLGRWLSRLNPWLIRSRPGALSVATAWAVPVMGLLAFAQMSYTLQAGAARLTSPQLKPLFQTLDAAMKAPRDPFWTVDRQRRMSQAGSQDWPEFREFLRGLEPFLGKRLSPSSGATRRALDSALTRLSREDSEFGHGFAEAHELRIRFLQGSLASQVLDREAGQLPALYGSIYEDWSGSAVCQALIALIAEPESPDHLTLLALRGPLVELRLSRGEYLQCLSYQAADELLAPTIESLAGGVRPDYSDPKYLWGWVDSPEQLLRAYRVANRLETLATADPPDEAKPVDLTSALSLAGGRTHDVSGSFPIWVNLCLAGLEKRLGLPQTVNDPELRVSEEEVAYPALGVKIPIPARDP